MSTVKAGKWVAFEFKLSDEDGDVIQSSAEGELGPMEYVHGYSPLLPGLHAELEGMAHGDSKTIVVDPEGGYGEVDEDAIFAVPRSEMPDPEGVKYGDELEAEDEEGNVIGMHVVEVTDDAVVLDANHPLAGVTLTWEVKIAELRDATKDEIDAARAEAAEQEIADSPHGPD